VSFSSVSTVGASLPDPHEPLYFPLSFFYYFPVSDDLASSSSLDQLGLARDGAALRWEEVRRGSTQIAAVHSW
jgi:hypothetical protein